MRIYNILNTQECPLLTSHLSQHHDRKNTKSRPV